MLYWRMNNTIVQNRPCRCNGSRVSLCQGLCFNIHAGARFEGDGEEIAVHSYFFNHLDLGQYLGHQS